jgi:cobalamin-dependent methionine synthase I
MIIIGEKINSSIPTSRAAIQAKDAQAIICLAKAQSDAGASFIDINAGMFLEREPEYLAFLAKTLDALCLPLSIDTPSAKAVRAALGAIENKKGHLINSVTIENSRLEDMTSLAAEYGCGLVALCMQENGMPESLNSRLEIADRLVNHLVQHGIKASDIFIDPMLRPLGADETAGTDALETIRQLRALFPESHISVGLSNLSFGLPCRRLLNRTFASAAMTAGLDAAIADPLDRELMGQIAACEAILGIDEYCLEFIGKFRSGLIG